MRNACKILVRKPERKISLVRHIHKWKDNIKIYVREIVCESVD